MSDDVTDLSRFSSRAILPMVSGILKIFIRFLLWINTVYQSTVGVASDGGLFNARLLSQIGTPHLLYGGKRSPGHRNKMIRKSGKQHITSYWRKFKRPAGQMVNIHGNRFGLLQE